MAATTALILPWPLAMYVYERTVGMMKRAGLLVNNPGMALRGNHHNNGHHHNFKARKEEEELMKRMKNARSHARADN